MTFQDLSLAKPVLKTLAEVGYEIPTPIQCLDQPSVYPVAILIGAYTWARQPCPQLRLSVMQCKGSMDQY